MKTSSPLRYPGGKSAMSGLLGDIRRINRLGSLPIAEPFAGGAGASLTLLYREETSDIYINDADKSIYNMWWTLVNRPGPFLEMISSKDIDIREWLNQRSIYRSGVRKSKLKSGFAAFYLNRANRSGIIMNGGPIGGIGQSGSWKIGARFNKKDLIKRCEKIWDYKDRISVSGMDGIEFIDSIKNDSVFMFIDPPYFEKGPSLYLNSLDAGYHSQLAFRLKGVSNSAWVLTYDDCKEIRELYEDWAVVRPFSLRYTASDRRMGKEVMITPKWMKIPDDQESSSIIWQSST